MDIKKCYEILELDPEASLDDAKQAYRDLVNVWHTDRVSNNPRVKRKAEEKLKEVNVAYKKMEAFLSSKQRLEPEQKEAAQRKTQAKPQTRTDARAKAEEDYYERSHANSEARDKTEASVETATGIILGACSYLYNSLRRFFVEQVQRAKTEIQTDSEQREPKVSEWQGRGYGRGKRKGKGMRRGRGMGRGGGLGTGRGRGRP
jgi:curved DNA-binding protein CbpA